MKVGILTRMFKFFGAWLIVVPMIAMLVVGTVIASRQDAVTGYQKASQEVAFYTGVATWNIPHLIDSFIGSKSYIDNSTNGKSTVPKSSSKSGSASITAQQIRSMAVAACKSEKSASKIKKCEADFVKAFPQQ